MIKHKKTNKIYKVLGTEGSNYVLKCLSTGKKFTQAVFAVQRDYEDYKE